MKVMVFEIPSFDSLLEKIEGLVEETKKPSAKVTRKNHPKFFFDEDDEDDEEECDCPPAPGPWGIGGEPADENLRFGYGLEVDEPRRSDYESRAEFLRDHELFDKFVDAGEACVARGLDKRNDAPITKCKAIRQPVDCPPPMGVNLLGETDWWDEDFEW